MFDTKYEMKETKTMEMNIEHVKIHVTKIGTTTTKSNGNTHGPNFFPAYFYVISYVFCINTVIYLF